MADNMLRPRHTPTLLAAAAAAAAAACLLFGAAVSASPSESLFTCDLLNNNAEHLNVGDEVFGVGSSPCGRTDNVTFSNSSCLSSCGDGEETLRPNWDAVLDSEFCRGVLKYRKAAGLAVTPAARDLSLRNLTGDGNQFHVEHPQCGGENNVSYSRTQRFTDATSRGTMDVLKSRREAKKKFRLDSDVIHTSVPSDDVFTAHRHAHKLGRRGGGPPAVGGYGVAGNHSLTNLTGVDGAAWNHSATNLTAGRFAACAHSVTNLTHGP